jgi:hypothetical protein
MPGSAKINNEDIKSKDNKNSFFLDPLGKLRQMSTKHPAMFLLVTADD